MHRNIKGALCTEELFSELCETKMILSFLNMEYYSVLSMHNIANKSVQYK